MMWSVLTRVPLKLSGNHSDKTSIYGIFCLYSLVFSSCSKELYASYNNKTIVCWTKPDDSEVSNNGYILVDRP